MTTRSDGWLLAAGATLLVRRRWPVAVLLAVFVSDTAAYVAGRLIGRHKMAPRTSPGKTWEGFVAGSAACIFVTWVALYEQSNYWLSVPVELRKSPMCSQ
jgi:phosphatidate cytidylyltransferase